MKGRNSRFSINHGGGVKDLAVCRKLRVICSHMRWDFPPILVEIQACSSLTLPACPSPAFSVFVLLFFARVCLVTQKRKGSDCMQIGSRAKNPRLLARLLAYCLHEKTSRRPFHRKL